MSDEPKPLSDEDISEIRDKYERGDIQYMDDSDMSETISNLLDTIDAWDAEIAELGDRLERSIVWCLCGDQIIHGSRGCCGFCAEEGPRRAVSKERERCAKIADILAKEGETGCHHPACVLDNEHFRSAAKLIAKRIREGT